MRKILWTGLAVLDFTKIQKTLYATLNVDTDIEWMTSPGIRFHSSFIRFFACASFAWQMCTAIYFALVVCPVHLSRSLSIAWSILHGSVFESRKGLQLATGTSCMECWSVEQTQNHDRFEYGGMMECANQIRVIARHVGINNNHSQRRISADQSCWSPRVHTTHCWVLTNATSQFHGKLRYRK